MQRSFMTLILIVIIALLSNSGCGGNNVTLPVTDTNSINSPSGLINPTPTPALSVKPVQGYIYANNITTEDGEIIPNISVIDVPAYQSDESGNEPFITQVSNSLQKDYPGDWVKPEIQELYAQLNKTLSECKPLPQYNAQASVYSVYQDSSHETPIPVNSDGHFDNTVLTGAEDSTVKLEVALGEDNYAEVETIVSSDSINSSDATNAELKSCPEKIFAFPGEIVIFKVYTEPGINLKSAGLKFSLKNNPSIGCITQPLYLCIFGAHKYQVAYGCLYVKNGLNTPVDTTITATTNSGLTLNIFIEVIKKTSSLSGTVYTGGMPMVKGFVRSLGPKACCKIDENGTYSLPKVFRGHGRSVVATWWTSENGQKVRHREEKVIDFFNQNVTGFNFGVPPTPTPTFTPSATPTPHEPFDPFYHEIVGNVTVQFEQWRTELGSEQAIEKTVNWLNEGVPTLPHPEYIKKAKIDNKDKTIIWIYFVDGWYVSICTQPSYPVLLEDNTPLPVPKSSLYDLEKQNNNKLFNKSSHSSITSSNIIAPPSSNILILAPYLWQMQLAGAADPNGIFPHTVYGELADDLQSKGYMVKRVMTKESDINTKQTFPAYSPQQNGIVEWMELKDTTSSVTPYDFEDMGNYGVIYIFTHGTEEWIYCGPIYLNDYNKWSWIKKHMNLDRYNPDKPLDLTWDITYSKFTVADYTPTLLLGPGFLNNIDFNNAIVYLNACTSYNLDIGSAFLRTCSAFLGYDRITNAVWSDTVSYFFFRYMMYGYDMDPPNDPPKTIIIGDKVTYQDIKVYPFLTSQTPPMSIKDSYTTLKKLGFYQDKNTYLDPNHYLPNPDPTTFNGSTLQIEQNDENKDIYLPAPVTIIIDKD